MVNATNSGNLDTQDAEFKKFAWLRIVGAIVLAVAVLWGITWVINTLDLSGARGLHASKTAADTHGAKPSGDKADLPGVSEEAKATHTSDTPKTHEGTAAESTSHDMGETTGISHVAPSGDHDVQGTLFVDSLIKPINHELNERFWGWRPNDIINITDNVNEMQLGTLEVTRRTAVALTEKISRTGSASSLNPHLENAMNFFMINADSYWMPSAEGKYNDAIAELKKYRKQLVNTQASFYTRSDSLIPLLQTLEDLLGSCDENLVKQKEDDGEPVSTFRADNYFYYAKGVARAMTMILHAVDVEFTGLLETRNSKDVLHHAIESAHHAAQLDPWLMVTEASLNGILANHRANMAAHISHARYYLGLLVKTLST